MAMCLYYWLSSVYQLHSLMLSFQVNALLRLIFYFHQLLYKKPIQMPKSINSLYECQIIFKNVKVVIIC